MATIQKSGRRAAAPAARPPISKRLTPTQAGGLTAVLTSFVMFAAAATLVELSIEHLGLADKLLLMCVCAPWVALLAVPGALAGDVAQRTHNSLVGALLGAIVCGPLVGYYVLYCFAPLLYWKLSIGDAMINGALVGAFAGAAASITARSTAEEHDTQLRLTDLFLLITVIASACAWFSYAMRAFDLDL